MLSPSSAPFLALCAYRHRVFGQRAEGVEQRIVVIDPLFDFVGGAALSMPITSFAVRRLWWWFQVDGDALQRIGNRVGAALNFGAVDDNLRILSGNGLLHRAALLLLS